jgi:hypothetical protein
MHTTHWALPFSLLLFSTALVERVTNHSRTYRAVTKEPYDTCVNRGRALKVDDETHSGFRPF